MSIYTVSTPVHKWLEKQTKDELIAIIMHNIDRIDVLRSGVRLDKAEHDPRLKPDKDLIRGVLRNMVGRTPNSKQYRFGVASDVFGIGSTMAKDLCIIYGLDPDDLIAGVVCERCVEEGEEPAR